MTGALHRVGQLWRHASARVSAAETSMAERILGPELAPLFKALPINDQRHGLDVLETATRQHSEPSRLLQQAALLHDVGKGGVHFSVIDRSLAVFLAAITPGLLAAVLKARPAFAARYRAYADHARLGAEQLRARGATELAAIVAEHHLAAPTSEVTHRLQRADHRN